MEMEACRYKHYEIDGMNSKAIHHISIPFETSGSCDLSLAIKQTYCQSRW